MKKLLALLLAMAMVFACFASCGGNKDSGSTSDSESDTASETTSDSTSGSSDDGEQLPDEVEAVAGNYTYNLASSTISTSWNPATYQTEDQGVPLDYITTGFYNFVFNDKLHSQADFLTYCGADASSATKEFEGYTVIPEMAAAFPADVTNDYKGIDKWGIPADATAGFAYKIALNPNATWENGTKITADDYIYSMQQYLNPQQLNYRAKEYYSGSFSLVGAESYAKGARQNNYTTVAQLGDKAADYAGDQLYIDVDELWGMEGAQSADGKSMEKWMPINDDVKYRDLAVEEGKAGDWISAKEIYEYFLAENGNGDQATLLAVAGKYFAYVTGKTSGDATWDTVGLLKTGDYEITVILDKSLTGFYLLYNLTGNWLLYKPYYDALLVKQGDAYLSTYYTDVATTMSYGPYKMSFYQADKRMVFVKNDNWYGYKDGSHKYVDPSDGKTYNMYQTNQIVIDKVKEAKTMKTMFLAGRLATYGLQSEDYDSYRSSDRVYFTPDETIFFFIFNGNLKAIQERIQAKPELKGLETIALESFRKAIAVTYDKEALCTAVSPSRSGGYGLIGNNYIYDPLTGAKYRDTDQAKKALCDFYSVDISQYDSLDDAVDSITGYAPDTAKKLFKEAFDEAIAKKYITDADNDGKSDQEIKIEYCSSSAGTPFIKKTLDYLNEKLAEVLVGTPFEGKVYFYESASYGDEWSNKIRAGLSDTVLGGWGGAALDPFGLTELYADPSRQYDAGWFNSSAVDLTINVAPKKGEAKVDVTLTLKQWSDALNGSTVKVGNVEYNFGDGQADVSTRLDILAAFEARILQTYDYIPMLQNASAALLTYKVDYVVDDYRAVMGRGGIAYMRYNYDDVAWKAYVKAQGGTLHY